MGSLLTGLLAACLLAGAEGHNAAACRDSGCPNTGIPNNCCGPAACLKCAPGHRVYNTGNWCGGLGHKWSTWFHCMPTAEDSGGSGGSGGAAATSAAYSTQATPFWLSL